LFSNKFRRFGKFAITEFNIGNVCGLLPLLETFMNDNQPKTFTFINNKQLVHIIEAAEKHIIYAAPSISESVAMALCKFKENNETAALRVVIDADPEVFRLGFGEQAGVKLLAEKQIDIRRAPGLRIAVLLADERAWVYSPTPEIILEQPSATINNAVQVNVEFAKQILFSIAPDISVVAHDDILDQEVITEDLIAEIPFQDSATKTVLDENFLTEELTPEIGTEAFTEKDLKTIETELLDSPPQKFDQKRKVRVYQGYFQFVEMSFSGCRLTGKTITLPKYLLSVADPDLRDRVKTTCRIMGEDSSLTTQIKMFEETVKNLRREFLKPLGERYGSVILRSSREEFDRKVKAATDELTKLRESIKEDMELEIEASRQNLLEMLLPGLMKNPPPQIKSGGREPDEEAARRYLNFELGKQMPRSEQLISNMQLFCDYKDVTFEMLNGNDFIKAINENYPEKNFDKLYTEEQTIGQRETKQE